MHKIRSQSGNRKNFTRDSGASSKFESFANRRKFVLKRTNLKQQVTHAIQSDAGLRWPRESRASATSLINVTAEPNGLKEDLIAAPSKANAIHASPPGYDLAILDATAMEIAQIRQHPGQLAAPISQGNAAMSQVAHPNDPPPSYEEATRDAIGNGMQCLWQKLGQELASSKTSVPAPHSDDDSNRSSSESEDNPTGTFVVNTPDAKASVSPNKREEFLGEDDSNAQLLHGSDYVKNAEEYRFVPLPADWHIQQTAKDPARVNVKLTNKQEDGTSAPSMPTDVYYKKYPSALTGTVGSAFANLAGKAANIFQSIFRTVKTKGDTAKQVPKLDAMPLGSASNYAPVPMADTKDRVAANTSSVK